MEAKPHVVIISAFGRGHWLAAELRKQDLLVTIVDVTKTLGKWTSEDWEGPFGFFQDETLTASQLHELEVDADLQSRDQGVTIWLASGPLELSGPLAEFLMQKEGLSPDCGQYIRSHGRDAKSVRDLPFQKNWLVHLAHQLADHVYQGNADSIESGRPANLFAPWGFRRLKNMEHEESLANLRELGAQVHPDSEVVDVGFTGKMVEGIEIKGKWSGLIPGEQFVWMLSSEDSTRFVPAVRTKLFPWGHVEAEWSWIRFKLEIKQIHDLLPLPQQMIVIQNVFCPWTHENLCILRTRENNRHFDTWLRIPTQMRFQRSYMEKIAAQLIQHLDARIPGAGAKVVEWPADYNLDYRDLGAPRFPVFTRSALTKFSPESFRNFYFGGPEYWESLDLSAQFRRQEFILNEIVTAWRKQQAKSKTKPAEMSP